jgi:hypothetical protein
VEAGHRHVVHLHLGRRTADKLVHLHPELSGIRLWLGVRSSVVANMLVFSGDLAGVATVADSDVDDKYFTHISPFLLQPKR